jgi:hypothetical protein
MTIMAVQLPRYIHEQTEATLLPDARILLLHIRSLTCAVEDETGLNWMTRMPCSAEMPSDSDSGSEPRPPLLPPIKPSGSYLLRRKNAEAKSVFGFEGVAAESEVGSSLVTAVGVGMRSLGLFMDLVSGIRMEGFERSD